MGDNRQTALLVFTNLVVDSSWGFFVLKHLK